MSLDLPVYDEISSIDCQMLSMVSFNRAAVSTFSLVLAAGCLVNPLIARPESELRVQAARIQEMRE